MNRLRLIVLCIAAAALGIGGASLAMWSVSGAPASPVVLLAGELELRSEAISGFPAGPVWLDASIPGDPRPIDPATFLASAGDVLRSGHMFTLDAAGDNLVYDMRIEWADPALVAAGVTATYTLTENPGGGSATVLADHVPLGTPTVLPPAKAGTRSFLIDVELRFAEDRGDLAPGQTGVTDIGRIVISADQTREGTTP